MKGLNQGFVVCAALFAAVFASLAFASQFGSQVGSRLGRQAASQLAFQAGGAASFTANAPSPLGKPMFFGSVPQAAVEPRVKAGIDVLATEHPELVRGKKIALFTAETALDSNLLHTIDRLFKAAEIRLIITGDPFFRETMPSETEGVVCDAITNAKVLEILDPLKRPSVDVFADAELLVVDFQDIGIRYFKYLTLLAQLLDVAKEASIPVLVLDRPNPVGAFGVSGPVLKVNFRSRFGVYPVPLLHAMTIGELALYFNKVFGLNANLTVVGMKGYSRHMSYRDTGLYWAMPTDHLPESDSPIFYAATGFLGEMGAFSTGVGTNRPFHYILAPWIDGELLSQRLEQLKLAGVRFIAVKKSPYYGLFAHRKISGVEIVITDIYSFDPFLTGLAILKSLYELYPSNIPLKNPAAGEAIDTLLGGEDIRSGIILNKSISEIYASIRPEIDEFINKRKEFLIYPE